jgi:predicted homoserine dehydrogenase-like protein
MLKPVKAGQPLKWSDVAFDASQTAVKLRREMELTFDRKLKTAA